MEDQHSTTRCGRQPLTSGQFLVFKVNKFLEAKYKDIGKKRMLNDGWKERLAFFFVSQVTWSGSACIPREDKGRYIGVSAKPRLLR